ncbi:HD domain-containing protein [Luteococcus sp. Sow4_B9]|uniref:HD domain-containing protein n=1 Tax=Luteococcus sp. Sow4_B9 TaxID=3438792 RepID=UPI003F9E922D
MTETIAGIRIPDSTMAREATQLVRDVVSDVVYDQCRRVFLFGSLRGEQEGLAFDPELLYVGAMFHDLGLTEKFRTTHQRFEVDAADEARRFLLSQGINQQETETVWAAIALR